MECVKYIVIESMIDNEDESNFKGPEGARK